MHRDSVRSTTATRNEFTMLSTRRSLLQKIIAAAEMRLASTVEKKGGKIHAKRPMWVIDVANLNLTVVLSPVIADDASQRTRPKTGGAFTKPSILDMLLHIAACAAMVSRSERGAFPSCTCVCAHATDDAETYKQILQPDTSTKVLAPISGMRGMPTTYTTKKTNQKFP